MGTSSVAPHESSDIETQSFESESSYDVYVQETNNSEFDVQTLDALGVVGRSEQHVNNTDQCFDYDDDETYEKQVIGAADVCSISPKSVYLPDKTSVPGPLQPAISQAGCCSNGMSQYNVIPSDVCSSHENNTEVTVNNHGHAGGSEFHRLASLTAAHAAEEETVRKNPDVDLAGFPVAIADDDGINGGTDNDYDSRGPSSSVELQADGTAGLADSRDLESVCYIEALAPRITEDCCNIRDLINSDLSFTDETVLGGELHSDTVVLPTSLSLQHVSSLNSDVTDAQSNGNNAGNIASLSQYIADHWSWLHSTIIWAAQICIYVYRYCTV